MKSKNNPFLEKQSKKSIKENLEILKKVNLLKKRAQKTEKIGGK